MEYERIKKIFVILVIISTIVFIIVELNAIIEEKKSSQKLDLQTEEIRNNIEKEEKIYNEKISKYDNDNYKRPYIPEKFSYIEGKWNNGFVIEDSEKNQFVWIPCCSHDNDDNVPIINKYNFINEPWIDKSECNENINDISCFLDSALENGGYYISRFETGKENDKIVSKKGVKVYTDIVLEEAIKLSEKMYEDNKQITSCLINSYAYDTAYKWLTKTNDIKHESRNITGDRIDSFNKNYNFITGNRKLNNIYDLEDDIWEWTTEKFYDTSVVRGIDDQDPKTGDNRHCFQNNWNDWKVGFRIIIYK